MCDHNYSAADFSARLLINSITIIANSYPPAIMVSSKTVWIALQ